MSAAWDLRPVHTGLPAVGDAPWGSHLCQFYRTREDLLDTLVPFFKAGLERDEQCLWITSEPLDAATARKALANVVPDLGSREKNGQIEILDHTQWYSKNGQMDAEQVLAGWLERERQAIDAGRPGLRLSGNTIWLQRQNWRAFQDYEALVHRAFDRRRILALCSYSIAHCSPEDILDVLRNHRAALLRRDGVWEVVRSATVALSAAKKNGHAGHAVRFYEGEQFPAATIAAFLADGLKLGEGAAAFATAAHIDAIVEHLRVENINPDLAIARGQLLLADASETLACFPFDGPDSAVAAVVEEKLTIVATRFPKMRGFGEMVDVLVRRGEPGLAVRLEKIWNDVLRRRNFPLLCTYSMTPLDSHTFDDVCREHADVHALTEALVADGGVVEAGELAAQLQFKSLALDQETERRRALEAEHKKLHEAERDARSHAERIAGHLGALQTVTAALSEAATVAEIARAVRAHMSKVLGAKMAAFATLQPDGFLQKLEHVGLTVGLPPRFEIESEHPLAVVFRSQTSFFLPDRGSIDAQFPSIAPGVRALAVSPIGVPGRQMGVIAFGFESPHTFSTVDRALVGDLASQTAIALDRARLYDEMREANRRKDDFLAILGHELRNPLAPIMTALQLMQLRGDTRSEKERGVIERQVAHVSRLVDDLLDVSRITRGKLELKREPVEISSLISRAMEMASPLFEQRSQRVTLDVPRDGLVVMVDQVRFAQAISNLLNNASKYTEPGGQIWVRCERVNGEARVRIRDSGAGIRSDMLPLLFEPFVQGQRTLERSQGGLGLGLALVKSLVDLHGGKVSATSPGPGKGSEFVIAVDALPSGVELIQATPAVAERGEPIARKRILVVDDNIDAAEALSEMFKLVGHDVAVAFDGPGAITRAAAFPFDVAVLDIGLPVMDGYELARRLRELAGTRDVRLIALTGYGTEEDRARTRASGFFAHFTKPVDHGRLLELVGDVGRTGVPA